MGWCQISEALSGRNWIVIAQIYSASDYGEFEIGEKPPGLPTTSQNIID